jgi:hypothetical protein
MSEDPCPTIVELEGGRRLHFELYLARDGAPTRCAPWIFRCARGASRTRRARGDPRGA